jgi:hypothetical protein
MTGLVTPFALTSELVGRDARFLGERGVDMRGPERGTLAPVRSRDSLYDMP